MTTLSSIHRINRLYKKIDWLGLIALTAVLGTVAVCIAVVISVSSIRTTITRNAPVSTWRGLHVAPEDRCSDYNENHYSYSQVMKQRIQAELGQIDGGWYGMYEARIFSSAEDAQIEHIVARQQAHLSGMCARSVAERRAFAKDLNNLTLASPRLNRVKGTKDAAGWLPNHARCWFARTVVSVKQAWELTVDEAERDALKRVLSTCKAGRVPSK